MDSGNVGRQTRLLVATAIAVGRTEFAFRQLGFELSGRFVSHREEHPAVKNKFYLVRTPLTHFNRRLGSWRMVGKHWRRLQSRRRILLWWRLCLTGGLIDAFVEQLDLTCWVNGENLGPDESKRDFQITDVALQEFEHVGEDTDGKRVSDSPSSKV